ncbi:MAG: hypothetical protein P4L69_24445 [Desulfosporosinus sp.]|nr:hypothetical protein [Desulfosporosinus sp.]
MLISNDVRKPKVPAIPSFKCGHRIPDSPLPGSAFERAYDGFFGVSRHELPTYYRAFGDLSLHEKRSFLVPEFNKMNSGVRERVRR